MTASLRACSLRLLWVLLIAGCQRDCRQHDDDDADARVQEDFYVPDGGQRDGGDGGGGNPHDGGGMDGGAPGDGGRPDGGGRDGGPADGGPDGNIDAQVLCPGEPPTPIGSANAPRTVRLASMPLHGRVDWRGLAFIEITGLVAGQDYVVTLDGAADLSLLTYSGDASFSTASCSDMPEPGYPAACLVSPTGTSVHVAIDAELDSSMFALDVHALPENESPDVNAPLSFAMHTLPVVVSAVPFQPSYYAITGLTAGQEYVISATGTQEMISLAARVTASSAEPSDVQTRRDPQVVATPTGSTLYIVVIARMLGTPVELSVKVPSYVAEGTAAAPVTATLATLPLTGQIPAVAALGGSVWERGRSLYAVTDLEPSTYLVRMTAEPGIGLIVFGDDSHYMTTPLCGALIDGADDSANFVECSARITGSTLHFAALNGGGDGSLLNFEVEDAPFHSEGGPLDRIAYSIAQGRIAGTVSASEASYYRLSDVTPLSRYRFFSDGPLDSALHVTVYEPGHADAPLCMYGSLDQVSECVVTSKSTVLDVEVRSLPRQLLTSNVGTSFVLKAEELPVTNIGTLASPRRFRCGDDEYHGEVGGSGSTYYEVSGLTPGATYVVELTGATGVYDMTISPSTMTWGTPCAFGTKTAGRCKGESSSEGKLYIRVHSPGVLSFDLRVNAATPGSEGSVTDPFVIHRSATPYLGRAASASPSYYEVTGLTRDRQYIVRFLSEQEAATLNVLYAGFGGTSQLQLTTLPGFPNETTFYALGTSTFFTVGLLPHADGVTSFSLEILPYD